MSQGAVSTSHRNRSFNPCFHDAPEWLAAMCSHIPDRGEQMVRYYGYYSNVSRGKRKETEDDGVTAILEADKSSKEYRKNWARLIQKIYEVDPLTCPKCGGIMRILAFIEDQEVIRAILKHLGLWLVRSEPTPKAHAPPALNRSESGQAGYVLDQFSQLPITICLRFPWDEKNLRNALSLSNSTVHHKT